ncbi:hypothetical protein [Salinigranum halophilum]|uniref:hypothetical protein n=1 Tax=Salinigranum halophilum TaxID=2565931 RepID=UPI0010A80E1B|nr:hypothetical protein [Salinigranum halophilum]
MQQPSCTRRALLRRGTTAATTAALASLAGCSGVGSIIDGSPDVPYPATWLPAPGRVFASDTDPAQRWYPFRARRFDELAAYLHDRGRAFESEERYRDGNAHPVLDIEPSQAGMELRAGGRGLSVLETDLLDDTIIEAFQTPESSEPIKEPFGRLGEYEGYRLFGAPDTDWVVGIKAGVVIEAFASMAPDPLGDKRAAVEAIIDARDGEGRYTDTDETLAGVVRRLGTGMTVRAGSPPVGGDASDGDPAASGTARTSAETENATRVLAFETRADAEAFAADPQSDVTRTWNETAVSRDGRFVTIIGTSHPT